MSNNLKQEPNLFPTALTLSFGTKVVPESKKRLRKLLLWQYQNYTAYWIMQPGSASQLQLLA